MKLLLPLLSLSAAASAHTIFTTLYVDGVSQGDGTGIRMRRDPEEVASAPIRPDDDAIACGYNGDVGNPRVIPVGDGATLSFEFRSWGNDASKGAIDTGHKGPCSIYLKKVDSAAADDNATGDGWFKLWEEGYDADEETWCTSKLGNGKTAGPYNQSLSVTLPKGLQGGYYLARPELLALHAAVDGDPQFYTGCAQIFLESDGDKVPKETVKMPGHVSMDDASVTFNIYEKPMALPYSIPGPAVAELVTGEAGITEQTEGLEPEGCIMANAGWCGFETKEYTDVEGCWEVSFGEPQEQMPSLENSPPPMLTHTRTQSGEECWKQADDCWDYASVFPTGGDPWCKIWGEKCEAINDACKAKDLPGPPNKGKVLTPPAAIIEPVMPKGTTIKSDVVGEAPQEEEKKDPATTSSAAAPAGTKAPSVKCRRGHKM
jgi:hypothetical protein